MSREEEKMFIVQKREEGHTYQEIADMLFEKFGVLKSKQAVYKQYKREASKMEISHEELSVFFDVVGYYSIGYSCSKIYNILKEENNSISLDRVKDTVTANSGYIDDRKKQIEDTAYWLYNQDVGIENVISKISYNGKEPTKKRLKEIMYNVSVRTACKHALDSIKYMEEYNEEAYKEVAKEIKKVLNKVK